MVVQVTNEEGWWVVVQAAACIKLEAAEAEVEMSVHLSKKWMAELPASHEMVSGKSEAELGLQEVDNATEKAVVVVPMLKLGC